MAGESETVENSVGAAGSADDAASRVAERDRDTAGRARNARPRDALGRPLPYGSPDVARQPEGIVRTPAQTLTEAQRLLDEGLPFHAHEVFEDAWKTSSGADRVLWKGMAQWAVGLTHVSRGNHRGAVALLTRGRDAIAAFGAGSQLANPHGIDIDGLVSALSALLTELTRDPPEADIGWLAPTLRSASDEAPPAS